MANDTWKAGIRQKVKRRVIRLSAIDKLGSKCARCGEGDHRVLEFDHVNGGGNRISSTDLGRMMLALSEGNYIGPEVQLLCANCHRIKTFW